MVKEQELNPEQEKEKHIYEMMDRLLEKVKAKNKFLITLHVIENDKIVHSYTTNDFPNGDLLPCVKYLEDEFVRNLKRGATGNGRM